VGGTARVPALLARGAAKRVGELSFRQSRQCSLAPGTRLPTALGWTAMATHLAGGRSWHRRRHGADVRAGHAVPPRLDTQPGRRRLIIGEDSVIDHVAPLAPASPRGGEGTGRPVSGDTASRSPA